MIIRLLSSFFTSSQEDIIHIKLVKILLPVVDPVLVLGLAFRDRALPDVREHPQGVQLLAHTPEHRPAVRVLIQIEAQVRDPVVRRSVRQDVHKHLLFIRLGKRNLVLDLDALHPGIRQGADHEILRLCPGF